MTMSREKAKAIIGEELNELRRRIIEHHIAAGQRASGRTIRSLRVEVNDSAGTLYGRKAFGVLETGRKAGPVPKSFIGVIRQWIVDKGIPYKPIPYVLVQSERWQPKYTPEERGLMSLAGAIAYKIRNEGTSLYRGGGRDDIYSQEIPVTVGNIMDRIFAVMEQDVEHINLNSNEKDND